MELAVSGQLLGTVKNLEEILEILKKYGVNIIEIWPLNIPVKDNTLPHQDVRYERRSIVKAKELLSSYGIRAACITIPGAFKADLVGNKKAYISSLCYAIEVAKELGAPFVNHYCIHLAKEPDSELKNFLKVMEPAVKRAEEKGITLVLENEAHDATRLPEGMLKILEAVNSKKFCTTYDACNYYHASAEGFPYAYTLLRKYIKYVHIKNGCLYLKKSGHEEYNKGKEFSGSLFPNHIYYPPIPNGAVNIDGLLLKLKKDGYEGVCTLEPHTIPENAESYYAIEVEYLRSRGFFVKGKKI